MGGSYFVGFADGDDLFEVMLSVNELEFAPLLDVHRSENCVAGTLAGVAKERFSLSEKLIEMGETLGSYLGKAFTRKWLQV
jgi:hypothetical protein